MTKIDWNTKYDVVVLGFGGAGATAARFASDNGAKVLLVDSAPQGHEGGNTRYAGQLVGSGKDLEKLKKYITNLAKPFDIEPEMIETYAKGMVEMPEYFKKYLGAEAFSTKNDWDYSKLDISDMVNEYPEYEGSDTYDMLLVHNGILDSALWKILRKEVLKREDSIDVWYESPVEHLVMNDNGSVAGVKINRQGTVINVKAERGVVLATGGFENNKQMVQDYLGATNLAPIGSLYNKGIGIKLAAEAKAQMWHMNNFESLGLEHGLAPVPRENEQARLMLGWPGLIDGSVFTIADDGSRYFNETEANRHGHIYDHGAWRVPANQVKPFAIFDEKQLAKMRETQIPWDRFDEQLIEAGSLAELAEKIDVKPEILAETVNKFNYVVDNGLSKDEFNRPVETMSHFDDGKVYAFGLVQTLLNTQGGPKRNAKAEVLNTDNEPISGLYSAGELGGMNANEYQGGLNIAECLIFGKIAGENAAKNTIDSDVKEESFVEVNGDLLKSDNVAQDGEVAVGSNEYVGVSEKGMGDSVTVKVKYEDGKLLNVDVLSQAETEGLGSKVFEELPKAMVAGNTIEVDAISGATVTSNALKDAVKNAIAKAK